MKKIITLSLSLILVLSLTFNTFATTKTNLPGNPEYTSPTEVNKMSKLKDLESFKINTAKLGTKKYTKDNLNLQITFAKKEGTENVNQISKWTSEKEIQYIFFKGSKCGHLYNVKSSKVSTNILEIPKVSDGAEFLYVIFYYKGDKLKSDDCSEYTKPKKSKKPTKPTDKSEEPSSTPEVTKEVTETPEATIEVTETPKATEEISNTPIETTEETTKPENSIEPTPSDVPSESSDDNLPKTGESSTIVFSIIGFLLVSIGLILRKKLIKQ